MTDVHTRIRKILSSRSKGKTERHTDKTLNIHRQRIGSVRRAHASTDITHIKKLRMAISEEYVFGGGDGNLAEN